MTPQDHIDKAIDETTAALADGLDLGDIATLLKNGLEIADQLDEVPGPEKKALALEYVAELLDKFWVTATPQMEAAIVALDVPYLSEGMEAALFDPIAKRLAPPLLKSVIKEQLPRLVDLVVSATKGGVQVNTDLWLKAASVIDLLQVHGEMIIVALDHYQQDDAEWSSARLALDAVRELARTL